MSTITPEERANIRHPSNFHDYDRKRLLDALEADEAARDAAIRELGTIATDYGRAQGYAEGMAMRAKSAEARAAEAERQRDRLIDHIAEFDGEWYPPAEMNKGKEYTKQEAIAAWLEWAAQENDNE